jgi:hypothetical protein
LLHHRDHLTHTSSTSDSSITGSSDHKSSPADIPIESRQRKPTSPPYARATKRPRSHRRWFACRVPTSNTNLDQPLGTLPAATNPYPKEFAADCRVLDSRLFRRICGIGTLARTTTLPWRRVTSDPSNSLRCWEDGLHGDTCATASVRPRLGFAAHLTR